MACLIYEIVLTLGFKVQIIRSAIIILISFQKIFIKFPDDCFIIFGINFETNQNRLRQEITSVLLRTDRSQMT